MFVYARLFAGLCLTLITTGCWNNKHHHAAEQEEIVVGMMSGYAPFMVINTKNDYEGFDIDVAKHLADKLGKKLVIKDMSLAALFLSLEQGRIDCIISGLAITQGRKHEFNMIHYQGDSVRHLPLAFWKTIPHGISTFDDLKKFNNPTICVEAGSSMEGILKNFPAATPRLMERYVDMILDVQYGKSFGVLLEPSTVGKLKDMFPNLVSINLPLPEQLIIEGNGIAVKRSNSKLAQKIEIIINDMKRDGTIATFERAWKMV